MADLSEHPAAMCPKLTRVQMSMKRVASAVGEGSAAAQLVHKVLGE